MENLWGYAGHLSISAGAQAPDSCFCADLLPACLDTSALVSVFRFVAKGHIPEMAVLYRI